MPYLIHPGKTAFPAWFCTVLNWLFFVLRWRFSVRTGFFFLLIIGATGFAQEASESPATSPAQENAAVQPDPDLLFHGLMAYEFGKDSTVLASIEAAIRYAGHADPEKAREIYAELETAFIAVIQSESASQAARDYACRQLMQVGSKRAVPVLGALLDDDKLSGIACHALQALPFAEADAVFLEAFPKASLPMQIAIVNILAQRASNPHHLNASLKTQATELFSQLVNDTDPQLACTAMFALGRTGSPEAAGALSRAKVREACEAAYAEACLACADALQGKGLDNEAASLYRKFAEEGNPSMHRVAALNGLVKCKCGDAAPLINEMLESRELLLRRAAAKSLTGLADRSAMARIVEQIPSLPGETAVLVLTALAEAEVVESAPAVIQATGSDNEEVRIAAIHALGILGGKGQIPLLARTAACGDAVGKAAAQSLARLRGAGVNDAIQAQISKEEGATRAALLFSLGERGAHDRLPLLLKTIELDSDALVREKALLALKKLARGEDIPLLLRFLENNLSPETSEGLVLAVTEACRCADDMNPLVNLLVRSLKDSAPSESTALTRASLVKILGNLHVKEALKTINTAAQDDHPLVRNAATAALAEWPDTTPTRTLLKLAQTARDSNQRSLVLQGLLKMAELSGERTPEELKALYETARPLAGHAADKQRLIESVGSVYCFWVLDFLAPFKSEPEIRDYAEKTLQNVSAALSLTVPHDASGCAVSYKHAATFNPGGDGTLTDDNYGSTNFRDGKWQGFNGKDVAATVDLGRDVAVNNIRVRFMKETRSWIFLPDQVRFSLSMDGKEFSQVASFERPVPEEMEDLLIDDFHATLDGVMARYVRVTGNSIKTCPNWHPGAGRESWVFIDEIQVNPHLKKPSDQ